MCVKLDGDNKVVGSKETLQAINSGKADRIFVAKDIDENIKNSLIYAARNSNINIEIVDSKMKLGRACGIDVAAASAALLK